MPYRKIWEFFSPARPDSARDAPAIKDKGINEEERRRLAKYRLYLALGGLFYPLWCQMALWKFLPFYSPTYDLTPRLTTGLWIGTAFVIPHFVIYGLSFSSTWVRDRIYPIFLCVTYLVQAHFFYLVDESNISYFFTLTAFVLVFSVSQTFENARSLACYMGYLMLCSFFIDGEQVADVAADPSKGNPKSFFIFGMFTILVYSFVSVSLRLKTIFKERKINNDLRNAIKDAKDSEDRMTEIVNASNDIIFTISPDLKKLSIISPLIERRYGIKPSAFTIEDWKKSIHPEDRDRVLKDFFAMRKTGEYNVEYRFVLPNNEVKWFWARASAIKNGGSKVVRYSGAITDITDMKLAYEKVAESERRFKALVDVAPMLIWTSGNDMLCDYFNSSWLEWRGRAIEEELGNGWAEGIHTDDYASVLKTYREHFQARTLFKMEYRLKHKDGTYRWIINHAAPRFGADGTFLGYIGACFDIEEQRKTLSFLEKSGAQLNASEEIAKVGSYSYDLIEQKIRWSDNMFALFGLTRRVYTPTLENNWARLHADDRERVIQEFEKLLPSGTEVFEQEYRMRREDGTYLMIHERGKVQRGNNGKPEKIIGSLQDVTEKKQTEAKIAEQNQFLKSIAAASPTIVYVLNLETGQYEYMSPGVERILGYPVDKVLSSGLSMIMSNMHPDDIQRVMNANNAKVEELSKAPREIQDAYVHVDEYRVRNAKSEYVWLRSQGVAFDRHPDGRIKSILGVAWDVTEQKDAADQNQALLNAIPDLMFRIDQECRVIDYHAKSVHQLVTEPQKFMNQRVVDVFPGEVGTVLAEKVSEAFKTEETQSWEYSFGYPDGIRYFRTRFVPGTDEVLLIAQDVTSEKNLAAQLEEKKEMLIQQSKLSSLGEMAAGIAHEINTPLNVIQAAVKRLQNQDTKGKLKVGEFMTDQFQDIMNNVKRIDGIIRSMRSLVRDNSKNPPEAFCVKEAIEDTLNLSHARFPKDCIHIETYIEPGLGAKGRQAELTQVITNLLNNAVDALNAWKDGREKKVIHISAVAIENQCIIRVSNNGPKIPKELREKIFEPFFTTKKVNQGTGLGLSISRSLIESVDGKLYLDESHSDTCFTISLIRAIQEEQSAA